MFPKLYDFLKTVSDSDAAHLTGRVLSTLLMSKFKSKLPISMVSNLLFSSVMSELAFGEMAVFVHWGSSSTCSQ